MKTFDLTVSHTIHGSAEEVFDVWLDPKSPGGLWFGVERAIINPVVDGLFYTWSSTRAERGRTMAASCASIAAGRSSTRGSRKPREAWKRS